VNRVPTVPRPRHGAFAHRDFTIVWVAALVSGSGMWMQIVAVPTIVYRLTSSATWLGITAVAALIPAVVCTPVAGVIADRLPPRLTLMATQTLMMVTSMTMWVLYRSGHLNKWTIVALSLVNGIGSGLNFPVWHAFVPTLVPRERLLDAVRANSMQNTMARAVGPAMAALTLHLWGPGTAIALNAVTYLLVIAALTVVHPRSREAAPSGDTVWDSLRSGAQFVSHHRPLRYAVILALMSGVFLQSLVQLAPAIANATVGHQTDDNAWFVSVMGAGAALGAVLSATVSRRWRRSRITTIALVTAAALIQVVARSHHFALSCAAFGVLGFAQATATVVLVSVVQSLSPDYMRGRTASFYILAIMIGSPLGALTMGRIADTTSMTAALTGASLTLATLMAAVMMRGWPAQLDATELDGEFTMTRGVRRPQVAAPG
jgi:MFS family permease